ncbi:hypothetical protein MNV49_004957 [Pseudohyphozyma bogoriensis]|nr:hypothetical protein MNV49_004957 [Pseudohyphozyma bogoriensis]
MRRSLTSPAPPPLTKAEGKLPQRRAPPAQDLAHERGRRSQRTLKRGRSDDWADPDDHPRPGPSTRIPSPIEPAPSTSRLAGDDDDDLLDRGLEGDDDDLDLSDEEDDDWNLSSSIVDPPNSPPLNLAALSTLPLVHDAASALSLLGPTASTSSSIEVDPVTDHTEPPSPSTHMLPDSVALVDEPLSILIGDPNDLIAPIAEDDVPERPKLRRSMSLPTKLPEPDEMGLGFIDESGDRATGGGDEIIARG